MEPASITFVRHGETEANAAEVWQGHDDSPLSERGQRQVKAVGQRLGRLHFDKVITSDLGRAVATAAAADHPFETDEAWRELDMGEWEGMARDEIFTRYADQLAELRSGKDIRWGGAETYGEFVARIDAATDRLAESLSAGERALVVAHGGVIHAIVAGMFGFRGRPRPWPVGRITNTSLTTIALGESRRMLSFNDAGHLAGDHADRTSDRHAVTFVRHGETPANVRGWWHGVTDIDLTPTGQQQAKAVAAALPPVDWLYSSPLLRAQRTAQAIGAHHGLAPEEDARLREMDFGEWEGLTTTEIVERFPDEWKQLAAGHDLPRGGSGDTFSQLVARMLEAGRSIANGANTTAVSHGGSIRALVTSALGLAHHEFRMLGLPANGSTTTLTFADDRMELVDFSVTAHLED